MDLLVFGQHLWHQELCLSFHYGKSNKLIYIFKVCLGCRTFRITTRCTRNGDHWWRKCFWLGATFSGKLASCFFVTLIHAQKWGYFLETRSNPLRFHQVHIIIMTSGWFSPDQIWTELVLGHGQCIMTRIPCNVIQSGTSWGLSGAALGDRRIRWLATYPLVKQKLKEKKMKTIVKYFGRNKGTIIFSSLWHC